MTIFDEKPILNEEDEHRLGLVNHVNDDLKWGLTHLKQKEMATRFIKILEGKLCVFAPSVRQVYSKYTFESSSMDSDNIVVLPDPYAFTENFNHINESAISKSSLYLLSGEAIGKQGIYVYSGKNGGKGVKPIPFGRALSKLLTPTVGKPEFLPVLMKGDLREFKNRIPCINLNLINPSLLESVSDLQKICLKSTIKENLNQLSRDLRLGEIKASYMG